MMLSEDYYGFRKKSPQRPTRRTELSEEKLNGSRSKQKQRLDQLRLQKLKQKYNQVNTSSSNGNGLKRQRRGAQKDKQKQKQRSKSKKYKFFQPQTRNQIRFRYYHYNDEPTEYQNQIRRRVQKRAMQSLEKDFNNRFNVIEGKSCVSQKIIKEAEDFLTRKSRQVCLRESLKSENSKNQGELKPISNSQPHRNLRKLKTEQKQLLQESKKNINDDDDESIDFDIETQKIKLLREKKLAYSQKQSMLLGTQTLQRKPKEPNQPKEQIKQLNESVISINSRHQNDELNEQSLLKPSMKESVEVSPHNLATSDYEKIKELEKRARDEQSQTSKVIEFNKVYPSSSSFSKSETNNLVQDSQSNTLSNLIKNSSEIIKKPDVGSSHSSRRSFNKESVKDNPSYLSKSSKAVSVAEAATDKADKEKSEKEVTGGDKQTDTSQRRQPLPAYAYENLINRNYYENIENNSLNISNGFQLQYLPYQNQPYHYSNSTSLKSSLQNELMVGSGQLTDNQNGKNNKPIIKRQEQSINVKPQQIQKQPQTNKCSPNSLNEDKKIQNVNLNSISFNQDHNFISNYQLIQSNQLKGQTTNSNGKIVGNLLESANHMNSEESMDGNKFSFVLQSNPQQSVSNSPKLAAQSNTPKNVIVSSFNSHSSAYSMDNTKIVSHSNLPKLKPETSIMANDSWNSLNQFISVPPNIFVRPSQENIETNSNLLSAIRVLNEEEDRKICNLYSTIGFENQPLQRLMDKIYEHISCVNKLIDFVADTQTFYIDHTQRQIFHVCSYLLVKRFYEQRLKILEHLKQGQSCFNLIGKQISSEEIVPHVTASTFIQFTKDLQQSNSKIYKIIEFMYSRLNQEHSFLSPPQYPISQQDLIIISEKLNEELELLIYKLEDNQEMREKGQVRKSMSSSPSSPSLRGSQKDNSYVRDNEYEAMSMRAFELMQLLFLISALEGRNVKKLQKQIQPQDFSIYCKNHYGLFKQTVLYLH